MQSASTIFSREFLDESDISLFVAVESNKSSKNFACLNDLECCSL